MSDERIFCDEVGEGFTEAQLAEQRKAALSGVPEPEAGVAGEPLTMTAEQEREARRSGKAIWLGLSILGASEMSPLSVERISCALNLLAAWTEIDALRTSLAAARSELEAEKQKQAFQGWCIRAPAEGFLHWTFVELEDGEEAAWEKYTRPPFAPIRETVEALGYRSVRVTLTAAPQ